MSTVHTPEPAPRRRPTFSVTIGHSAVTLLILLALCAIFAVLSPVFLTQTNLTNVLRQTTIVVIVAVAGTMVLISGGLDISVGGVLALTGVVFAQLAVAGVPLVIAILLATLVGGVVGLLNAVLVVRMGGEGHQTTSTILPICAPDSISACAFDASASGKVL